MLLISNASNGRLFFKGLSQLVNISPKRRLVYSILQYIMLIFLALLAYASGSKNGSEVVENVLLRIIVIFLFVVFAVYSLYGVIYELVVFVQSCIHMKESVGLGILAMIFSLGYIVCLALIYLSFFKSL